MIDFRRFCLASGRSLALAAAMAAAPAWADGACTQWDASGTWTLIQSNDTAVSVSLDQNQNGLSGQASFGRMVEDDFWLCSIAACGDSYVSFSGPVVATIKGSAFEATVYWSDNKIGVYTGEIGPQGLIVGTAFDKTDPRSTAQWHSNRVMKCSAAAPASPVARTGLLLGRVPTSAATPTATAKTLCELAASARARNSPAAPGLERRCAAQGGLPSSVASFATESVSATETLLRADKPMALGRVTASTVPGSIGIGNAPSAKLLGRVPVTIPAAAPAAAPAPAGSPTPPVRAPHDLVVGRLSYMQDNQRVTQPVVGKPVAVACNYFVNEVAGPFNFAIQPWQGLILIGGRAPQTLIFQGSPAAGQHEARLVWTAPVAGDTPFSCVLNPNFATAEANAGNNRWNETINVVPDEAPAPAVEEEAQPPRADDPDPGQAQQE